MASLPLPSLTTLESNFSLQEPKQRDSPAQRALVGTVYSGRRKWGDFTWMCQQPEFSHSLFLFNDNEEYHSTCRKGKGNAIMRRYNKWNRKLEKPIAAGIPTGTLRQGGYTSLDSHVINQVCNAMAEIRELLETYSYDTIVYSVDPSGKLGTNLFSVCPEVIDFIDSQIRGLVFREEEEEVK
jgi:hypothetical protein